MCNLFVANLPLDVTEAEVRDLFAPFGHVIDIHLLTDYGTGCPKGVGFIELDAVAADRAVESLHRKKVGDRMLVVDFAHPSLQPTWRLGHAGAVHPPL